MATETQVIAQFSWEYTDSNGSKIAFSKGEKFLLLHKATEEWWKVQRISCEASLNSVIYVPATYVKELPAVASNEIEYQEYKSVSTNENHDYVNLDAFRVPTPRSDSCTDSDYSYSDNDTASSLSISPSVLSGSFSVNPHSSTTEIRKSLNLDAVLGSRLQKQVQGHQVPKSSATYEFESSKDNFEIKNADEDVVLRRCMNTRYLHGKRTSTLPAGWQRLTDDISGRQYYYNENTKESVWKSPKASIEYDEAEKQNIPAGWVIEKDNSNEDVFVNSVNSDKWKACLTENGNTYYYKLGDGFTAWKLPEMEVKVRGARRRSLDDLPDDRSSGRMSSTFPRNFKAKSVMFGFDVISIDSKKDLKLESPKTIAKLHRRSQSTSMLLDANEECVPSINLLAIQDKPSNNAEVEGYLTRKKLVEGGKSKKYHWEQVYVCKFGNALLFYKDKKSSIQKPDHPSGRPDSSIDLRGATLEAASLEKSKGKKNVFQISTYNQQTVMLLMAENPLVLGNWITPIQLTINALEEMSPLPPSINLVSEPSVSPAKNVCFSEIPSITTGSPTLQRKEKVEKTDKVHKGFSRKLSKRPSNLNDEDANKVKIKNKLKKFLPKRPTYYELEKKGIIKQEVFGCHLDVLCKRECVNVPNFVVRCIVTVEKRGLHVKGIYRECGNASQMHKLRISTDQGEKIDFDDKQWSDVHVIAGALKWYFRELPEPLIPSWSFDRFVEAIKIPSNHERLRQFRSLIESLPKYNYETLKFLLQHLLKVIEFSFENKMEKHNCSIVFGPTLLRPEDEENHLNIALNTVYQNQIVNFIISEYAELFSSAI